MSAQTLEIIQAKRLAFLKASKPRPPTPAKAKSAEEGDDGNGGLPDPPTEADVATISGLWKDSKVFVDSARNKLGKQERRQDAPEWDIVLFQLFISWVVNLGREHPIEEAQKAIKAGDTKGASTLAEQSQDLIYKAAKNLDLQWIPFVDLALTPFDPTLPDDQQESGPFGGVFVSRGEFPFLVLAFKGTTFAPELATDKHWLTSEPRDGLLYRERAHAGMVQGLFEKFPDYDQTAYEIIFDNLELVAKDIQSSKGTPVPLYVTGHSLGAGYGDLTFIQLTSQLASATTTYRLLDLYTYGGPRVSLNPLAVKVKQVLADTGRLLWRIGRNNDIVPSLPMLVPVGDNWVSYIHYDVGYRLTPNIAPYWNKRLSEINGSFINDLAPDLKWHWPPIYYEGIRKVLDTA